MTLTRDLTDELTTALGSLAIKADKPPRLSFDLSGFEPDIDRWKDDIIQELTAAFLASFGGSALPLSRSRMAELAAQYALERAGELLSGGKYDVGAATLDRLKAMVAQAVERGSSIQELRDGLRDDMAFSKERATVIARTETASALGAGRRAVAEEQDQDEKSWDASGESCPECLANQDDGWIAMEDAFSSSDDDIPAHPNCTCVVNYRTRSLHEEDAVSPRAGRMKEARCPNCGRLEARNVNAGAELVCRRRECRTRWTVRRPGS